MKQYALQPANYASESIPLDIALYAEERFVADTGVSCSDAVSPVLIIVQGGGAYVLYRGHFVQFIVLPGAPPRNRTCTEAGGLLYKVGSQRRFDHRNVHCTLKWGGHRQAL